MGATPKQRARVAEVIGMLMIALAILAVLLVRYGGTVAWHAR